MVGDLSSPRNDAYRGTPLLAVEIRGTQSRRYLEEKVKLYLEHEWPWVWIAHAERRELEVVRPGTASITYRPGAEVPLLPELGKHGLGAVPVAALFEERDAARFTDEWVEARTQARAILAVLSARGLAVPEAVQARVLACDEPAALERWLVSAATAASGAVFAAAVDRG